jgi:O-methyltransferase
LIVTFYGIKNEQDSEAVNKLAEEIKQLYVKNGAPILHCDNMMVALRNFSFLKDETFKATVLDRVREDTTEFSKIWRLHTYAWCCGSVLALPGDYVECGVHMGLYSSVMLSRVDLAAAGKKIYLYDTFEGLDDRYASNREQVQADPSYQISDWEQRVRATFAEWPHAIVVKGAVPDILSDTAPDQVAFLHLDMNAAEAEIAALDFFENRLVPGATILIDDFGRLEHYEICEAMMGWFDKRNLPILEMPTGQGMVTWWPAS